MAEVDRLREASFAHIQPKPGVLDLLRALQRQGVMMAVGMQMLIGAAGLLPAALLLEWGRPLHWSPVAIAGMIFSVLLPGLYATWLWFRLVTRIGPVRAATYHFLSPIFGVAIAAALLGERFGLTDIIGATVVAAGILMVQLARVPAGQR